MTRFPQARLAIVCAGLCAALCASSCSSAQPLTIAGDFASPAGLALAPARDRDLLFAANQGGNELRVISICRTPSNADGSSAETTCLPDEDFNFVPGPIRVFPGSFPSGQRPSRLAGLSLRGTGGDFQGAVLVAGVAVEADPNGSQVALPVVKLVDAANVIDALNHIAPLKEPSSIPVDAPVVDVVAFKLLPGVDPEPGAPTPAFILTQEDPGVPAQLVALSIGPSDFGPSATAVGRCALDFIGARLALPPGASDRLYVADGSPDGLVGGRGDGAVEILTSTIPALADGVPPPCTVNRRISARDPATQAALPLRSIAVAPAFRTADGRNFAAGDILGGVSQDGRLVLLSGKYAQPLPLPGFQTAFTTDDGLPGGEDGTAPRMEPLRTNGLTRDVVFLNQPLSCPADTAPGAPCTLIRVGTSLTNARSVKFALVAAVSSSDGAVYFVDVDQRRFISETRDGLPGEPPPTPSITTALTFSPTPLNGDASPTLDFTLADKDESGVLIPGGHPDGWFTPGVTRRSSWTVAWHAPIPGLARRGGTLSRAADGNLRMELPGADLSLWVSAGQLDVGDVVAFAAFTQPSGSLCGELASENIAPLAREYAILGIEANALVLSPSTQGTSGAANDITGFNPPDSCLPAGAVIEARVAEGFGGRSWLVLDGIESRGRAKNGEQFVAYETRFDYPLTYDPLQPLPTPDRNTALSFTINGKDPVAVGSLFAWSLDSGHSPTNVRDALNSFGFADPLTVYTSKKIPGNLVFVSQSGANAVLQIDPSLIGVLNGVLAYR